MTEKRPVKVFQAGGVKAAIWENDVKREGNQITVHSIQIDRTFKQGDEYKRTNNYNVQDLPKLCLVAKLAYKYMTVREPIMWKESKSK